MKLGVGLFKPKLSFQQIDEGISIEHSQNEYIAILI